MLLEAAQPGDTILTTEVSRLSRSTQQLCEISARIQQKRLRLTILGSITVDCRSGALDPMTKAFLQMSGIFAELELSMIRARVKSGMAAARAGVAGCEIDAAGRKVIADAGYGEYFTHGFGHGLGIEGHENPGAGPNDTTPLPAGAVVSAEPGIYIPGRFGVRIENLIALTETGCEDLNRTERELIVL